MDNSILIIIFMFFYFLIILEGPFKVDKAGTAIFVGTLLWLLLPFMRGMSPSIVHDKLLHHIFEIAGIILFLKGAMSIVEIIDAYHGIDLITNHIKTKVFVKLLWIISVMTFFLSAILDNLTTAIVMISFIRKLNLKSSELKIISGMIIIAANAGGAWSPIGDVTTTMLWITERITSIKIIQSLFLPSCVSLIIPLLIVSIKHRSLVLSDSNYNSNYADQSKKIDKISTAIILVTGILSLISVPILKQITGLPPFVCILFGLGFLWIVAELTVRKKPDTGIRISEVLHKVDFSSIFFFTG
ncbi:MAG: sodium:proton antiporter NhaD [Oligoflexia bacterium]|nr:sodium:proton antiporter NhaD [Oligoflexia bacterium]